MYLIKQSKSKICREEIKYQQNKGYKIDFGLIVAPSSVGIVARISKNPFTNVGKKVFSYCLSP